MAHWWQEISHNQGSSFNVRLLCEIAMTIIVRFCVLQIAQRLQLRLRNYLQVLRTNKITVENLYKFHVKQPITQQYDCCSIPCKHFKWVLQSPLSLSPTLLAFSALPLDSFSFFLLPPSPLPTPHLTSLFSLSLFSSVSPSLPLFPPPPLCVPQWQCLFHSIYPHPPPLLCVWCELSEMLLLLKILPQLQ